MSRRTKLKNPVPAPGRSPARTAAAAATHNPRRTIVVALLLFVITLAIFAPACRFEFVNYDDNHFVTENPHVQGGFTSANIAWAFTNHDAYLWHPLTWFTHMVDFQLYGMKSGGHHFTNLLFHSGGTVLLFLALLRLTGAFWRSALVAALFAWHPLHVQSVAWVAERKDVLSGFFWMLTLWGYCRYVERPGVGRYLAVLGFFALGLMSKPMVVTAPCVMLLLDVWPLKRLKLPEAGSAMKFPWGDLARLIREKIPFFLLVLVVSVLTVKMMDTKGGFVAAETFPLSSRLANAVVAYGQYLLQVFWPFNLAAFYPLTVVPLWKTIAALILILALTIWALRTARTQGWLAMGWFWFLGTLVPTIGILQNGSQSMADRYTYIPYVGLFIALVWGAAAWAKARPQAASTVPAVCGVLLAACLALTSRELQYWRNSITLFARAVEVTKGNYVAYDNLAVALEAKGRYPEAIENYRRAVAIYPGLAEANLNLASLLFVQRQPTEAIVAYRKVLASQPTNSKAHIGLGVVLDSVGQSEEAVQHLTEALRYSPNNPSAYAGLGLALNSLGRLPEAEKAFHEALRLAPDLAEAHSGLGTALVNQGKSAEAIASFQIALKLQPGNADALTGMGMALALMGRPAEAETELKKSIQSQDSAAARNNLANVLLMLNRPAEAIVQYQAALKFDPNWVTPLNSLAWLLATQWDPQVRNGAVALQLARRACELTQNQQPALLNTLAAALAETGQFADAITTAQKALAVAQSAGQPALVEAIQRCLLIYAKNQPYHDPKP